MYERAIKAGGQMSTPPVTQGLGPVPNLGPGMPPPPTGVGAMPTGAPSTTKKTAGDDVISALRAYQGFVPELFNEINSWIDRVKSSSGNKPGQNPGPGLGQPGAMGALAEDSSPLEQSGSPGPM